MRHYLFILLCTVGIHVYAADYTPFAGSTASVPAMIMQSVNNASYMSVGSTYSSSVYEVGSSGPAAAPARGIRKSGGPGIDDTGYDPSNPQFATLDEASVPLVLIAICYILYSAYRRKRKKTVSPTNVNQNA